MPIPRTPIVDDSGTGTDGTVINNAWKQEFYDQIDTLAGTGISTINAPFRFGASAYHVVNVPSYVSFQPAGGAAATVWLLDTSAMATYALGIVAEPELTRHLLVVLGVNSFTFHNQHAGTPAANRLMCPGGASSYALTTVSAIWIMYVTNLGWVMEKPS